MKDKKAFTLVELVIVIAVIAILAAVLIPTFSGIVLRARTSSVLQRATSVRSEVLGEYFDTVAEMNGVKIIVANNNSIYTYTINASGDLGDATSVAGTLPAEATNTGDYYRTYGNDVAVIIPANADFSDNTNLTTLTQKS